MDFINHSLQFKNPLWYDKG